MSKLVKGFKGLREFLGVDHIDDEHDDLEHEMDEFEEKAEKPQDKKNKKSKKEKEMDELEELEFSTPMQGAKTAKTQNSQAVQEPVQAEENGEDCQTIFIDPKDFSECKKIAKYIKNDQMVTLNLEYLEPAKAQRMMDFLMGAMLVTGAKFIQISSKVYTSVPKSVKVHYAGKKDMNGRIYSMEKDGEQEQY